MLETSSGWGVRHVTGNHSACDNKRKQIHWMIVIINGVYREMRRYNHTIWLDNVKPSLTYVQWFNTPHALTYVIYTYTCTVVCVQIHVLLGMGVTVSCTHSCCVLHLTRVGKGTMKERSCLFGQRSTAVCCMPRPLVSWLFCSEAVNTPCGADMSLSVRSEERRVGK